MKRTRAGNGSGQSQRPRTHSFPRQPIVQKPSVINDPHNQARCKSVSLVTNAYSLDIFERQPVVYEYDLKITTSTDGGEVPLKVISRNFVARSIRKLLMEQYLPSLVEQPIGDTLVIDTNLEKIYSLKPLRASCDKQEKTLGFSPGDVAFVFKSVLVKTDLLINLLIDITIRFSAAEEPSSYSNQRRWSLVTSVIHHQPLLSMLRYGSVYYSMTEDFRELSNRRFDLISNHVTGMSLSGLRSTTSGDTLIVISCTHSYITKPYRLIDLLASFIKGVATEGIRVARSVSGVQTYELMQEIQSTSGREEWFSGFCTILNGFKCRVEGLKHLINVRFNLTEDSAERLIMNLPDKGPTSVIDYYKSIGVSLHYPNLPCLKSNSNQSFYYPLELCTLIPCQKVPIFRLSTNARNHLSTLNKPKPEMSRGSSSRARDELEGISKDCLSKFGIKLSKTPVEAKGAILQKPRLQFKDVNISLNPDKDFWESKPFFEPKHLGRNWCVVNTVPINLDQEIDFFRQFELYCRTLGFVLGNPVYLNKPKQAILEEPNSVATLIDEGKRQTKGHLMFIMFVIDSSSTQLNRLIHLSFDDEPTITATCLRADSIMNRPQQRSIFRTLIHKLNTRLGGTNVTYHVDTFQRLNLNCSEMMIVGLDVTHPDNELSGVSIVGCAYTYSRDLFKHRSIVWPQSARVEIIGRVDELMKRLLAEYHGTNSNRLPRQIIIYRDGVSHEEFEKVQSLEVAKAEIAMSEVAASLGQPKPNLSYIIAQKRHTMRFYQQNGRYITNPPSGTLIDKDVVSVNQREFYLFSNTGPQATARPLHYHVLQNGLGVGNLQNLTYALCFNFGRCSSTLSMPSSLRYAHNAAYDARNRVIASREFSENRFYTNKFFC